MGDRATLRPPVAHLCGRRYAHRTESQTEIKVYSNQPRVTLFVDGKEFAAQDGDKIFKFTVPISGTHEIKAVAVAMIRRTFHL